MLLLGVIFVTLITSSVLSIAVDDLVGNKVVSEDVDKYEIYLHVIVRNAQGELISVADTIPCQFGRSCAEYMPHEITDYAFDTSLGKKEIITIDDIEYEIVQFSDSFERTGFLDMSDHELAARWVVEICGESIKKYGFECAKIFQSRNSTMYLEVGDITMTNWTVLRVMN